MGGESKRRRNLKVDVLGRGDPFQRIASGNATNRDRDLALLILCQALDNFADRLVDKAAIEKMEAALHTEQTTEAAPAAPTPGATV